MRNRNLLLVLFGCLLMSIPVFGLGDKGVVLPSEETYQEIEQMSSLAQPNFSAYDDGGDEPGGNPIGGGEGEPPPPPPPLPLGDFAWYHALGMLSLVVISVKLRKKKMQRQD